MEYVPAKTITTKARGTSWFGIDYNMNIYRGCCHDCIYCDSRSDCYQIDNFDTVRAKEDALRVIRDNLRQKAKLGVVDAGSMSDPYNPFEGEMQLTRHALGLINASGFGVTITAKGTLMMRDMGILGSIKGHSPVLYEVTITTADGALSERMEPYVACSSERFAVLDALGSHGIYAGILLMPAPPFLEGSGESVLAIVRRAHEASARFTYPAFSMTLRNSQRGWYFDKLDKIFPGQNLPEQYIRHYGNRYECHSPRTRTLWNKSTQKCAKYGALYDMKNAIHSYKKSYEVTQLSTFDQYLKAGTHKGE